MNSGTWHAWNPWGDCTKSCAVGSYIRSRTCRLFETVEECEEYSGVGAYDAGVCNVHDCPQPVTDGTDGEYGSGDSDDSTVLIVVT
eukprot:UN10797